MTERLDANRASFTRQAPTFEDARFNAVLTSESDWVFDALECAPDDLLLDVAAGTGHGARALAARVRAAVCVDATPAMLTLGREQAAAAGLDNIVFQQGDAAALPFPDASFDIVVCRYALHHFPDVAGPLAELRRCVRPGGHVVVADLVADADPVVAELQNELERVRDPSHARALSLEELTAALRGTGVEIASSDARAIRRPLAPWLEQTETSAASSVAIREALADELAGGARTGFAPERTDAGDFTIVQTLVSLVARAVGG